MRNKKAGGQTPRRKGEKNMKSYGYEAQGNEDALRDVTETMNDSKSRISWNNFKTGDFYWTGNGDRYKVEIDHEAKK